MTNKLSHTNIGHGPTWQQGRVYLNGGQKYDIQIEFVDFVERHRRSFIGNTLVIAHTHFYESMNKWTLFLAVQLSLFLGGCQPEPFKTTLAGYTIWFPISMAELQKNHPNGYKSGSDRFIDSTEEVRIEWWFNHWGESGNQDSKKSRLD